MTASILELFQHQNSSFLIQLCWIDTKPGYFLSVQAESIFISTTDQSFHIDMLNAFYLFQINCNREILQILIDTKIILPYFYSLGCIKESEPK